MPAAYWFPPPRGPATGRGFLPAEIPAARRVPTRTPRWWRSPRSPCRQTVRHWCRPARRRTRAAAATSSAAKHTIARAWQRTSLGRDGDQRKFFVTGIFRHGEKEHDGREGALGAPVTVVHQEPLIAVMYGSKGVRRLVRAALDLHRVGLAVSIAGGRQRRQRTAFLQVRLR